MDRVSALATAIQPILYTVAYVGAKGPKSNHSRMQGGRPDAG